MLTVIQRARLLAIPVEIRLLETQTRFLTQVAAWHHQECERQGLKSSLALRQQRLVLHIQAAAIPKTLVALRYGELVGCVSLVNYTYRSNDLRPESERLGPVWLSNLFVLEAYRHQGIGGELIAAAKAYAKELGLDDLWLSASDYTEYYERRGWTIERKTRLGGKQVNVMQIQL